jgi:hypothetical protein
MEGIGVVSLVNDSAGVACRRACRPSCLPRRVVVEFGGHARRYQRRCLRNSDDRLDAPPALVASFARRGALGTERELARSVAGVLCAGGVGLLQRGARARARPRVPARLLGRGEDAIREIDRVLELTTMAITPARQVQRGRQSEGSARMTAAVRSRVCASGDAARSGIFVTRSLYCPEAARSSVESTWIRA